MKPRKLAIAFLLVVLLFTFVIYRNKPQSNAPDLNIPSAKAFSVVLAGEAQGIALFVPQGEKLKVDLSIPASSLDTSVYIEKGSCEQKGERLYELKRVIGGKSETLLDRSADELLAQKPVSIKAYSDRLISCGELPLPQ